VLFSKTHERLKQLFADRLWNAGTVVQYTNFNMMFRFTELYFDLPGVGWRNLACVAKQIYQCALDLLLIEPGFAVSFARNRDFRMVKIGMRMHCVYSSGDRFLNPPEDPAQRFPSIRKLQQRIDQVRHLVHGCTDFTIEFLAFMTA